MLFEPVRGGLPAKTWKLSDPRRFGAQLRAEGFDWPAEGEATSGLRRLQNLQDCIVDVLQKGVDGDLMEAGWRGGATIFMRGVLKAFGDQERTVWVADSFAGLPPPNSSLYPNEGATFHLSNNALGVSLEEVKVNIARYGLLDDRVRFLKGWFKDTLPNVPITRLALMRLDGDIY
jgi:O-methyltransferase